MDRATLQDRSTAEVEDTLCQLLAMKCLVERQAMHCLSVLHEREVWRQDGATGMPTWLAMRTGLSRRTASEFVRVASVLESLPALEQAFCEGSISFEQLAPATRLASAGPEDEFLARHAPASSPEGLERSARLHRRITPEEEEKTLYDRSHRMRWNRDRTRLNYWGHLPGADGALYEKAVERGAERRSPRSCDGGAENEALRDGPPALPFSVRCANAVAEMASLALGADPDPDRATLVVSVGAAELQNGGNAEIHGGVVVGPRALDRLACDCRIQLLAHDSDGRPVGVGRTTRVVPPWLHRVILDRDKECIFPSCGRTRWLECHHLVPFREGGPTDEDNLGATCFDHHHLAHEGGWRVRSRPSGRGVWWIRPDGSVLDGRPAPLRDEVLALLGGPDPPDTS